MTPQQDLMMAILSLDAYNHQLSYETGMNVADGSVELQRHLTHGTSIPAPFNPATP